MNTKLLAPSVIDYLNKWNYVVKDVAKVGSIIVIEAQLDNGEQLLPLLFSYNPGIGTLDIVVNEEVKPAKYYNNYLPERIERLFELNNLTIVKQMINESIVAITVAGDKLPNYRYDTEEKCLYQREKGLKFQEYAGAEYANT